MKTSKFMEAQIAFVLNLPEAEMPVTAACRKAGISDAAL